MLCRGQPGSQGVGILIYFSAWGHATAEQSIISGFQVQDSVQGITCIVGFTTGSETGSISSLLTLERRRRPLALHECGLNSLDSKISAFSDGSRTNFQSNAQVSLKKLMDRVLFRNILLRDRIAFRNLAPEHRSFSDFPAALPVCSKASTPRTWLP